MYYTLNQASNLCGIFNSLIKQSNLSLLAQVHEFVDEPAKHMKAATSCHLQAIVAPRGVADG